MALYTQGGVGPSSVPRPNQLRNQLLQVLGHLTEFQAQVLVPISQVIEGTIRELGLDPQNLPSSWPERRSHAGSIDRQISLCYRNLYRNDGATRRKGGFQPLTLQSLRPGFWGLSDSGIEAARATTPFPLPTLRVFGEPLLQALGRLAQHTLQPVARVAAMRETLVVAGYNPDALPLSWDALTSNGQPRFQEALRWLARSMSTFVCFPERGLWALTPSGLERAAKLNGAVPQFEPIVAKPVGPNSTARWFSKHLTPKSGEHEAQLMRLMRGAVIKHMPISAQRGLIDDHINNFVLRAIRRDSFATVLQAGDEVPFSKVTSYCVNSSRSDARDMGTEPVCREMMGARTNRERHQPSVSGAIPVDTDGTLVPPEGVVGDVGSLEFEAVWKQIEDVVRERLPDTWERYSDLIWLKAQGMTTREIATTIGMTPPQATKMLTVVRQLIQESCQDQGLSFAV